MYNISWEKNRIKHKFNRNLLARRTNLSQLIQRINLSWYIKSQHLEMTWSVDGQETSIQESYQEKL